MPDNSLARTPGKYVCEECGGQTLYRYVPQIHQSIVYVNHVAQCETGIRHRISATRNRRIPAHVKAA